MKQFGTNIANLFQIKKIIALILTGLFVYMCVYGMIDQNSFMAIFSLVIGFYYGQSTAKSTYATVQANTVTAACPYIDNTPTVTSSPVVEGSDVDAAN